MAGLGHQYSISRLFRSEQMDITRSIPKGCILFVYLIYEHENIGKIGENVVRICSTVFVVSSIPTYLRLSS